MTQKSAEARTQSPGQDAKTPKPPSTPGPEHKLLNAFLGTWRTGGQQHEGLVGPAARITAVETYEWLAGEFFLVHRFEGRVGDGEAACIEIIGYDTESRNYLTHTFYNNGLHREWRSDQHDGTWTLTGDYEIAGRSMKVRCTTVFADTGETMTGKWEHSNDGSDWQVFWVVEAERVR